MAANQKFIDMGDSLKRNFTGDGRSSQEACVLPEKMMIPKPFGKDIREWPKWKNDVTKYFDDEKRR